jgi:hypothetical protein
MSGATGIEPVRIDRDPRGRQAQVVRVRDPADGHDHPLGRHLVLSVGVADHEVAVCEALCGGLETHVDAERSQPAPDRGGERRVDRREDASERFDDGDA